MKKTLSSFVILVSLILSVPVASTERQAGERKEDIASQPVQLTPEPGATLPLDAKKNEPERKIFPNAKVNPASKVNWSFKSHKQLKPAEVQELVKNTSYPNLVTITLCNDDNSFFDENMAVNIHMILDALFENKNNFPALKELDLGGFVDCGPKSLFPKLVNAVTDHGIQKVSIRHLFIDGKQLDEGELAEAKTSLKFVLAAENGAFASVSELTITDADDATFRNLTLAIGSFLSGVTIIHLDNVSRKAIENNLFQFARLKQLKKIILYKGINYLELRDPALKNFPIEYRSNESISDKIKQYRQAS